MLIPFLWLTPSQSSPHICKYLFQEKLNKKGFSSHPYTHGQGLHPQKGNGYFIEKKQKLKNILHETEVDLFQDQGLHYLVALAQRMTRLQKSTGGKVNYNLLIKEDPRRERIERREFRQHLEDVIFQEIRPLIFGVSVNKDLKNLLPPIITRRLDDEVTSDSTKAIAKQVAERMAVNYINAFYELVRKEFLLPAIESTGREDLEIKLIELRSIFKDRAPGSARTHIDNRYRNYITGLYVFPVKVGKRRREPQTLIPVNPMTPMVGKASELVPETYLGDQVHLGEIPAGHKVMFNSLQRFSEDLGIHHKDALKIYESHRKGESTILDLFPGLTPFPHRANANNITSIRLHVIVGPKKRAPEAIESSKED